MLTLLLLLFIYYFLIITIFQGFLPYDLPTYSMPHLSHTSLLSPMVNPFVPSNIFNLLQDQDTSRSEKASTATLRPFQIYDPSDPITALSIPTTDVSRIKPEQSPSTQVRHIYFT